MKQKIILMMFALILLFGTLLQGRVFASSALGYVIDAYDVDMVVNENNTFDITETITANFTGKNKHGIVRQIPLKNKITRPDGTKSDNRVIVSNISVSDSCMFSYENGYIILKIGSSNQTVSGRKLYTIKYHYNIGKDPLKDADELYFNLIGDGCDTSINNVTFTITMPKGFDKSTLGFSMGYRASIDNSNVNYEVIGNTISGELTRSLYAGQALTVRLTLPEGYFVIPLDFMGLFEIGIPILFVIVGFVIWIKYRKENTVLETVEFYPPDGLDSLEIGFIYKGRLKRKDITSLLISLASKGFLGIEEFEEETSKRRKLKSVKIIKKKGTGATSKSERIFLNGLFKSKNNVANNGVPDDFYLTIDKIYEMINCKENEKKIFEKAPAKKKICLMAMIIAIFLLMEVASVFKLLYLFKGIEIVLITFAMIIAMLIVVGVLSTAYKEQDGLLIMVAFLLFTMNLAYLGIGEDIFLAMECFVKFMIKSMCAILLIIFLKTMKRRTEYGNKMLGRIRGFKHFLKIVKKSQLEELVMENPTYFFDILPYTYVLGVSKKWIKKFENITLEPPKWYSGDGEFDTYSFDASVRTIRSSISKAMLSSPVSSDGYFSGDSSSGGSSGGGSSGGGHSGGGSGGGGVHSW